MKVVINKCFGGFGLSTEAHEWLIENRGWKVTEYNKKGEKKNKSAQLTLTDNERMFGKYWDSISREDRTNKDLIDVVTELGSKANGKHAQLEIIDIPDGIEWEIDDYDGNESIEEKHRSWG